MATRGVKKSGKKVGPLKTRIVSAKNARNGRGGAAPIIGKIRHKI